MTENPSGFKKSKQSEGKCPGRPSSLPNVSAPASDSPPQPSVVSPAQSNTKSRFPSSPPENQSLGNIPPEAFVKDLSKKMKTEKMAVANSYRGITEDVVYLDTSDEEEFDLLPGSDNAITTDAYSRIGTRNEIYGYQYACPYVITAHMGKNGPFSNDKIYDKEFITDLFVSLNLRNENGLTGKLDSTLLCNRLDIHSVKMMRDRKTNSAKSFKYSNGGSGYFHVFVRVFTKAEVKSGKNNEKTVLEWLEKIRTAFCATKAQYPFRLQVGGLLGRQDRHLRALDTLLLDGDVAEYAKIFHAKKIRDGTMMSDLKRVNQYFSVWNYSAAKDMLS